MGIFSSNVPLIFDPVVLPVVRMGPIASITSNMDNAPVASANLDCMYLSHSTYSSHPEVIELLIASFLD